MLDRSLTEDELTQLREMVVAATFAGEPGAASALLYIGVRFHDADFVETMRDDPQLRKLLRRDLVVLRRYCGVEGDAENRWLYGFELLHTLSLSGLAPSDLGWQDSDLQTLTAGWLGDMSSTLGSFFGDDGEIPRAGDLAAILEISGPALPFATTPQIEREREEFKERIDAQARKLYSVWMSAMPATEHEVAYSRILGEYCDMLGSDQEVARVLGVDPAGVPLMRGTAVTLPSESSYSYDQPFAPASHNLGFDFSPAIWSRHFNGEVPAVDEQTVMNLPLAFAVDEGGRRTAPCVRRYTLTTSSLAYEFLGVQYDPTRMTPEDLKAALADLDADQVLEFMRTRTTDHGLPPKNGLGEFDAHLRTIALDRIADLWPHLDGAPGDLPEAPPPTIAVHDAITATDLEYVLAHAAPETRGQFTRLVIEALAMRHAHATGQFRLSKAPQDELTLDDRALLRELFPDAYVAGS